MRRKVEAVGSSPAESGATREGQASPKAAPVLRRKRGRPKKSESPPQKTVRTKKAKVFRINAKNLILTYAQCSLSMEQVFGALMQKLSPYRVENYLLVRELHQDGGTHFHALISCEKKVDRKGESFLDLEVPSQNGETLVFHGSYEKCKSEEDTISYLTKDIFKAEEATQNMKVSEGYSRRLGKIYEYLSLNQRLMSLARDGEISAAMELLLREDPDRFLEEGSKIKKRLQEIHLETLGFESKYPLESFLVPPDLENALEIFRESLDVGEGKVFVLQGPPGCGKTQFLKSYLEQNLGLKVLVVNDIEGLRHFKPEKYTAILFDDPDFRSENRERLIQALDCERMVVRVRYVSVTIPANVPKAMTLNFPPEKLNKAFCEGALQRRMIKFKLESKEVLFDRRRTAELTEDQGLARKRLEHAENLAKYRESERAN